MWGLMKHTILDLNIQILRGTENLIFFLLNKHKFLLLLMSWDLSYTTCHFCVFYLECI